MNVLYLILFFFIGGIATARRAAEYGANVAIIEKKRLGGTCVNVGCVPKKVMWNAATLSEHLHDYPQYGFSVSKDDVNFNWNTIKKHRDEYVKRLNGIYKTNLDKSKVTLIEGDASFITHNKIKAGETIVEAKNTLITTGGYPRIPNIPGAELGITR